MKVPLRLCTIVKIAKKIQGRVAVNRGCEDILLRIGAVDDHAVWEYHRRITLFHRGDINPGYDNLASDRLALLPFIHLSSTHGCRPKMWRIEAEMLFRDVHAPLQED
jgi:hypothetical protein